MTFSTYLWHKIAPIYQDIVAHPFNRELAEGTLAKERFLFYIEQDAYYLIAFARALAHIAGRLEAPALIKQFLDFSLGALVAERELHENFIELTDLVEISPACLGYTEFLLAKAASAPVEEAIAAIVPCFWIYREIGSGIIAHESNPYISWIDTYSCPAFAEAVDQVIRVLDKVAETSSPAMKKRMEKAFTQSALYEWHFWNDAYERSIVSTTCSAKESAQVKAGETALST